MSDAMTNEDPITGTSHKIPEAPLTMPDGAPAWAIVLYSAQQQAHAETLTEIAGVDRRCRERIHALKDAMTLLGANLDHARHEQAVSRRLIEAEIAELRERVSKLERLQEMVTQ